MRIAALQLRNWGCFAGDHELVLPEAVCAVTAQHSGNADRSNWLGKSTLLEAVPFALYGEHRYRTEDEWVTRGEKKGGVTLLLDNGMAIERRRDGSTKLFVRNGHHEATGAEAEALVVKLVGLTREDFYATCYFRQRQMARFVLADPGERMGIVSAWFQLAPLQEGEAVVRGELAGLYAKQEEAQKNAEMQLRMVEEQLRARGVPEVPPANEKHSWWDNAAKAIVTTRLSLVETLEEYQGLLANLQQTRDNLAQWKLDAVHAEQYAHVVERGTVLAQECQAIDLPALQAALDAATAEHQRLTGDVRLHGQEEATKRKLVRGEFDGVCPVAGIDCPAKDAINKDQSTNLRQHSLVLTNLNKSKAAVERAGAVEHSARSAVYDAKRKLEALEEHRANAVKLKPAVKRIKKDGLPPDDEETQGKLDNARDLVMQAEKAVQLLDELVLYLRKAEAVVMVNTQLLKALRNEVDTHREALVIFGRNGAQRRVAEGALGEIEAGANDMLGRCGIDLGLKVQWAREGNGLADGCDACGAPYPNSQRMKECPRCGTQRGPKLVNRLDLVLTDRSGAAEDLAGGAFQLAASAWLRTDRGSPWGVALLDEPFGQLDASNRKAFANHLAAMLRGSYGFEQALVVAHHPGIMDSLPARIEITSDGRRATAKVVT